MENNELIVKEENQILGFSASTNSNVEVETHSSIQDPKKLFNLETNVDVMLNDIVGESIKVKDVLIRKYRKPLDEPIINADTGEIEKDTELKVSCVLIDDQGKSYATGSKTFTFDMMKFLGNYNGASLLEKGVDIKVIKKPVGKNGNKALSFELL